MQKESLHFLVTIFIAFIAESFFFFQWVSRFVITGKKEKSPFFQLRNSHTML